MFDQPVNCENATPNNTCLGGTDESLLSFAEDFQTFVAVDNSAGGVHTVNLYGGEAWGFRYSNTDPVPEPPTFILLGSGLAGLLLFGRRPFFKKVLRRQTSERATLIQGEHRISPGFLSRLRSFSV
jgi:hypothetical protein